MTELKYFHGDAIKQEFPEHLDWFVPGFLKNINKIAADFGIKTIYEKIDYNKYEVALTVKDKDKIHQIIIDFRKNNSLDSFISSLIDSINDLTINSLDGFIVIAYRPFNDSNISLTLGNWMTLEKIDDFKNLINNPKKFHLSKNQLSNDYLGPKKFEDLKITHYSPKFEADYYLPFFPEDNFKRQTVELLESIALLDKNNNVQFEVTSMTSEEATIIFLENNRNKEVFFNARDFDKIGHELNEFKKEIDWRFVLIQPDEDNLIYAFCSQNELMTLEKSGFIREDYIERR
jgi:hypothetical protein